MRNTLMSILLTSVVLFADHTWAGLIDVTSYSNIDQDIFENLGSSTGQDINGVFTSAEGFLIGERFEGQTVSVVSERYDVLSGQPTNPLKVIAGPDGANLYDSGSILGIGNGNFAVLNGPSGIRGEGSVAVYFPSLANGVGLRIGGTQPITYRFYDANAVLLSEFVDLVADLPPQNGFIGFTRTGGISDIAGFTAELTTSSGFGLDYIVLSTNASDNDDGNQDENNSSTVPAPATLALLGLGLVGLAWSRRKRED